MYVGAIMKVCRCIWGGVGIIKVGRLKASRVEKIDKRGSIKKRIKKEE